MFREEQRYVEEVQFSCKEDEVKSLKAAVVEAITNRPTGSSLKVLIYFNPNAGSNSAKHLDQVLDFVEKTNLEPVVVETEHQGHCQHHLQTIDPKDYCGVAIVSGDGLMHEFVNSKVELPVTHVPAGSGNGFAKTQTMAAN